MLPFARPVVALIALALVGPPLALAQEKAGIVSTIQGTATAARVHLPEPVPLKFKDDVFQNDRIVTGDRSLVRMLLGGKAVVTVRERSALTITETPGRSTINLGTGKIAVAVAKEKMRSGESLEVRTPNAVAAIRGTVFVVEVIRATAQAGPAIPGGVTTKIYGFSGSLLVDFSGHVVTLPANQVVSGTGTAPPTLQAMSNDDRSDALSGLTANPQHVDGGQESARDLAMGSTVTTFDFLASPTPPPVIVSRYSPPPVVPGYTTCTSGNTSDGSCPDTGGGEQESPAATALTSPLCCPENPNPGHISLSETGAGTPVALMSGGSLSVGTESASVNLFELTGSSDAATRDATTGLTLGTDRPLRPGSGSPVFQGEGGATITVHGSAFKVDTALLTATAPLLKLAAGTEFAAERNVVDLTGRAKVSITPALPNDAVAMVSLNASALSATNGHLVNVAGGSVLNVAGSLVSLANGSTLTVNGLLLNVSGGSVVTLGKLVSFSGTGNTINVTNNLAPTVIIRGIPIYKPGDTFRVTTTTPLEGLGTAGTIKINGVTLTSATNKQDLTGSLIAVQGGGGTVKIGP